MPQCSIACVDTTASGSNMHPLVVDSRNYRTKWCRNREGGWRRWTGCPVSGTSSHFLRNTGQDSEWLDLFSPQRKKRRVDLHSGRLLACQRSTVCGRPGSLGVFSHQGGYLQVDPARNTLFSRGVSAASIPCSPFHPCSLDVNAHLRILSAWIRETEKCNCSR